MATLSRPDTGNAIKDAEQNNIKHGALVRDDFFGEGFATGVIACEVSGGFNVLINWRQPRDNGESARLNSWVILKLKPQGGTP